MGVIEFELMRVVHASVDDVFTCLADIEGHNDWMPHRGSIFRHTEQTSLGPVGQGTTYLDKTLAGPTPGEISEFERPTRLVYHWWNKTKGGRLQAEGWQLRSSAGWPPASAPPRSTRSRRPPITCTTTRTTRTVGATSLGG